MAAIVDRPALRLIHPLHAFLLAGTTTLFVACLLADIAYARSSEIQWTNFAAWLNVGGLLLGGAVVAWAVVDAIGARRRGAGRTPLYLLLVVATWIVGFVNALYHARDAWAVMPTVLVLSVVGALLACAATWVAFSSGRRGGVA